jgi:cysteine desulfurase
MMLKKGRRNMKEQSYYLDNCATTCPDPDALSKSVEKTLQFYANPSSGHIAGSYAKDLLEESRQKVATSLGAKPSSVVFTSGGTEANSIVLNQFSMFYTLASQCEHSSIGNVTELIPITEQGHLDINYLHDKLSSSYKKMFVSVMLANHETGVILDPFKNLKLLKEKYDFVLHVDAVQGYGKLPVSLTEDEHIDFLTISAHKVHGLKGIGALYINPKHSPLKPLFIGGAQERGVRPGTQNMLGAYNFGLIADLLPTWQKDKSIKYVRDLFEKKISALASINGNIEQRIKNVSNVTLANTQFTTTSELGLFLEILSEHGIHASANSACKTGFDEPSNTLRAMYGERNSHRLYNSIRFSFPTYCNKVASSTTEEKQDYVERIVKIIGECVDKHKTEHQKR